MEKAIQSFRNRVFGHASLTEAYRSIYRPAASGSGYRTVDSGDSRRRYCFSLLLLQRDVNAECTGEDAATI
jgi:hypothetical protein